VKLKTFIKLLETLNQNKIVEHGLSKPCCWIGDQTELDFSETNNISVKDMLEVAKSCIGRKFYYDSEVTMHEDTEIHVSNVLIIPFYLEDNITNVLREILELKYILRIVEN
jgi:hypothetical protein